MQKKRVVFIFLFLKIFLFYFCIHVKFHLWITHHFIPFFLSVHISYISINWAIKWNDFCWTRIISIENMGDKLDVRISVVRHIQEEFGHDVQEIEKWLIRSTKLDKRHIEVEIIYPEAFIFAFSSHPSTFPTSLLSKSQTKCLGHGQHFSGNLLPQPHQSHQSGM